jgi:hypothetical protein
VRPQYSLATRPTLALDRHQFIDSAVVV